MFESLKTGLSKFASYNENSPSTNFDSTLHDNLNRLELARLALSDTVRRNGIPRDWLQVELLNVDQQSRFNQTHLQLVMSRWSEQLLHYSAAVQQQFLASFDYFEPGVDHSAYVVSWRFATDCVVPSALIPDGTPWHVSAMG